MNWLKLLIGQIVNSKWFWIGIVSLIIIVGVVASVSSYITSLSQKFNALQNELAKRDTLLKISEQAYTRLAFVKEEVETENTQLKKVIEKDKAEILTLSSISQTTKVESVYIHLRNGRFDYSNPWVRFSGNILLRDSVASDIFLDKLWVRDSVNVVITLQKLGLVRGYVVSYSPYTTINNATFEVAMPQTKYNLIGAIRSAFVSDETAHLKPTTYIYAAGTGATVGISAGGKLKHAIIGASLGLAAAFVVDYFILGKQH